MVTSEEAFEEDTNGGEEDDTRTMREVRRMVNSITTDIQMEETVASSQEGGKLPVLDFQVWKEVDMEPNGKEVTIIKFEFYEKEMVSRFVMLADGALPDRMKTTVLAQEALRRERNTSRNVDKETRVRIRNKFLMKLRLSGYTARQRMIIVLSGVKGYENMVKVEREGGRKVNRAKGEGDKGRRMRKVMGKTEWYRKNGAKPTISKKTSRTLKSRPAVKEMREAKKGKREEVTGVRNR